MIYNVLDLDVYKTALSLLKDLYNFLSKVPYSEFDSVKNCKRAAKSIPANLAEGFAKRKSEATFKNHLQICIGSSDEVVAHVMTIATVTPRLKNDAETIAKKYIVLSKRLNMLHKNWRTYKY